MKRQKMTLALQLGCGYGMPDCLREASAQFKKYPTEPDRDQKLTTYCFGIQEGTSDQWDTLWNAYKSEINANELYAIRYGLACSKNTTILQNYLSLAIGSDVRVQDKHILINQERIRYSYDKILRGEKSHALPTL